MNNKIYHLGTLLIAVLFTLGCTKERTEECNTGLKLNFSFTHHTQKGNLFGEEVNRVSVYMFDENDKLILYAFDNGKSLEYSYLEDGKVNSVSTVNPWGALPNDYEMNLDMIPEGKYKIISWAGSGSADNTTYFHGEMVNPAVHEFKKDVTLGVTTMADFRMFLKTKAIVGGTEKVEPEVREFDDLWYGAVGGRNAVTDVYTYENVTIEYGANIERTIDMIRNSNILNVTISGIDHLIEQSSPTLDDGGFEFWVTSSNGEYCLNNSIGEGAPSIRYSPFKAKTTISSVVANIKIMRLDFERHKSDPILLYIKAPNGRMFPSRPLDVVGTLLQARDIITDKYIYNNQSDFDRIYEHPIELRIGSDLSITIFIGEWEIVNVKPA